MTQVATRIRPGERSRVLLVEDSPDLAWLYRRYLRDEAIELEQVETGAAALTRLRERPPMAVLLDLKLPDMSGLRVLDQVIRAGLACPVVMITAYGSIEGAVEAIRAGAYDFLAKPVTAERLVVTLRNALERGSIARLAETLGRARFHGFIGASLAMQAVYRIIESAATTAASVFITGESGTGKEICARAIHDCGPRRNRPFIALDCGAIPRDLMESEIFGHRKGAFTGAVANRPGAAKLAHGGSLFLDEICELDPSLQAKLLRFAQTSTIRQLGGDRAERLDVRLICATNREPLEEVEAGRLRPDLYYRLHVIPVHLPALRARPEDILPIARHTLSAFAREEGKAFKSFSAPTEDILTAYDWPGNVRQLQNVIRNAVVLHQGSVVQPAMLPPLHAAMGTSPMPISLPFPAGIGPIRPLRLIERDIIETAIDQCGGSIARAAALLGVSPSTIYRKRITWRREMPG